MSFLLIRSVQLSTDTATAWKASGGQFARRGRSTEDLLNLAMNYEFTINLGKSDFAPTRDQLDHHGVTLFNHGEDIKHTMWPGAARQMLDQYLPPQPTEFPAGVWIKAPGMKGRGKFKKVVENALVLPKEWDWQLHIEGQEFRIITVGNKIVQNLRRYGSNEERNYEWVPMVEMPMPLKRMVRQAAGSLPGKNVLAWDTILDTDGTPYILEANSCPGMSENTGRRIYEEAVRQTGERPQAPPITNNLLRDIENLRATLLVDDMPPLTTWSNEHA